VLRHWQRDNYQPFCPQLPSTGACHISFRNSGLVGGVLAAIVGVDGVTKLRLINVIALRFQLGLNHRHPSFTDLNKQRRLQLVDRLS
jgi:hypothetical protein